MPEVEPGDHSRVAAALARRAGRRKRTAVAVVAGLLVVLLAVAGAWGVPRLKRMENPVPAKGGGVRTATVATATPAAVETSAAVAEVPSVVGLTVDEATIVLRAVGLTLHQSQEGTVSAGKPQIASQMPEAGALAALGSVVDVAVPLALGKPTQTSGSSKSAPPRFVVCIDPGHQAHSDSGLEPLGPGSPVLKPKVTGGATGVASGVAEYEVALELATNLQSRLEAAGVRVVMTRTTNDVDLTNVERAKIADDAKADLFIRIHADSSTDPSACGVSTLYPAMNVWTRPIYPSSKKAAKIVQASVVHSTGAPDNGAEERADLAGFNWSVVPSVLVEAGFLSNSVEDRLLSSPRYQDQVAQGIADGALTFLRTRGR